MLGWYWFYVQLVTNQSQIRLHDFKVLIRLVNYICRVPGDLFIQNQDADSPVNYRGGVHYPLYSVARCYSCYGIINGASETRKWPCSIRNDKVFKNTPLDQAHQQLLSPLLRPCALPTCGPKNGLSHMSMHVIHFEYLVQPPPMLQDGEIHNMEQPQTLNFWIQVILWKSMPTRHLSTMMLSWSTCW